MGICVMPVKDLLDFIFEDYESFATLSTKEQEIYWNVIKAGTNPLQFDCIVQYHEHKTNSCIRIRAEDAQELFYRIQEE